MKTQKLFLLGLMMIAFPKISAYDFEADGIYYNITSMSDLEVSVTNMYSNYQFQTNSSYAGDIIIPPTVNYNNRTYTVTAISNSAFGSNIPNKSYSSHGCDITKIYLPSTIRSIGYRAFYSCRELTEIIIPNGVIEIGKESFYDCTSLSTVIFPNTLITIGEYGFGQCTNLGSITLLPNITMIEPWAFSDCKSLIEVFCLGTIKPNGLTTSTFSGAHKYLEIYVPSTKVYGFGKEYISFAENSFGYTGQSHNIDWTNNLKAYRCEIPDSECITKENNAGEHTQYLTATYSNGVDFTVEIPYEYTINKAPMTLTVNNVQREYGEPNPAFSCNITGWVNGENEQTIGATPSFDCDATQRSNVGEYRILASLGAPNYEITYQYGTLSILKAPLVASVINSTKIYGNPNPQFDLSFSRLKNGETSPSWEVQPTFYTSATEKSSVGEYEVTASNGIATNYNISSYTPGVLSITKKDLTVKANDCERLYGEDNPEFTLSFIGFVKEDSETNFASTPTAECIASINSNAGTYPITVNGGSSENYNFIYQDGTLTINPLTVGFKDVYNSVTFDDMSVSVTEEFFYYIPKIFGPYNEEDFWLELMALDKDNKYPSQHVTTISGGEYAGDYINYSTFMLGAGKYIFNLTSKGTNPNVVANPSRAYVTVNRASTNLDWNASSPIRVKVGEKVDLGISYQADLWCTFNTDYDKELISLSSEGATTRNPHWYITGLNEGVKCSPKFGHKINN